MFVMFHLAWSMDESTLWEQGQVYKSWHGSSDSFQAFIDVTMGHE